MRTSENGKQFILDREESGRLKTTAYKNKGDIPTIAAGNTRYEDGSAVKLGDRISLERAKQLFDNIILQFEKELLILVTHPLNQNQWDAMMSFIWNFGYQQLKNSKTIAALNAGNIPEFLVRHLTWTHSGNPAFKAGLLNRRNLEQKLFLTPCD